MNIRSSLVQWLATAIAVSAGLCGDIPVPAAETPGAALVAYNLHQPAKVDRAANRVELSGGGLFRVRCDAPAVKMRVKADVSGWGVEMWIEGAEGPVWEKPGPADGSFEIAVAFDPPAPVVTLALATWGGSWVLRDGILTLVDGREVPLAPLFVEGHEKLGPPRLLHVLDRSRHEKSAVTPPLSVVSPAEAAAAVEREWRLQRGRTDLHEACWNEAARARRILDRQAARRPPGETERQRCRIDALAARIDTATLEELAALYLDIRRAKRAWLLGDPAIDFDEILCIDNPYPAGGEAWHQVRARNEDVAVPGGRLLVLRGLGPDAEARRLAPREGEPPASFWRPDLSFDARKVLYSMKSSAGTAYHLHEIGIDGAAHRQLTDGGYNDLDPIYAPDGGIVFTTTRVNQFLRCGGSTFRMAVLARADANARNIYFLSANNEIDHLPSFLPDGRILYCRWEYVDKEVNRVQSLWTVHPDGTNLQAFWGNQSKWPDMVKDARPIPGSPRYLFTAGAHHWIFDGGLGILDPREGINYPDGVYNLTPHLGWPEVGRGPAGKPFNEAFRAPECYVSFLCPVPISEELFLVSARTGRGGNMQRDPDLQWMALYLMDYDGNMELLFRGAFNILFAQPVRPRPVPDVLPSRVAWPGRMESPEQQAEPGALYSADVYAGSGIPRGKAKALRILEVESLSFGDGDRSSNRELNAYLRAAGIERSYVMAGETAVSLVFDDSVKRIIGTVPVEPDGSVYFEVPPLRAVYFQLLDERGRALQTMRSLTHVMPGESRGCVGCHETRSVAPSAAVTSTANPSTAVPSTALSAALSRPPSRIAPPPWGDAGVGFDRFVQPVLDRHCISCHNPSEKAGELDFTHRTEPGTLISWPYALLLWGRDAKSVNDFPRTSYANPIWPHITYPNTDWAVPTPDTVVPPMTALSYNSRLMDIATSGEHYDVKVSAFEEAMLAAWIDALCPYLGLEEILEQSDPDPDPWLARFTYAPRMRTAPVVHRAFMQDEFNTQDDRIPKDAEGNPLPSVYWENGRRKYRIPSPSSPTKPK